VSEHPTFTVDPWAITETRLDVDHLARTETIFALSNGHIGLRGNLDEGEPHGVPGSYLNGVFETFPLPYAEDAYAYPREGQSLIDVHNGKHLRLLVDDEPLDVRLGTLEHHERTLDLRAGVLRRELVWTSPSGKTVRVRSTRLVSFSHRSVAAVEYVVESVGAPARVVVQSVLEANEPIPASSGDPRAAAALRAPLVGELHNHHGLEVILGHRTRASGLRVVAAIDHLVEGAFDVATNAESDIDLGRVTFSTDVAPGQPLRVVKLLGYGWSSRRSMPALRDQVDAALAAAMRTGWEGLLADQRAYLDEVWARADVEIDGDDLLQQAVRFATFQVVQAGARAERRPMPAKGLTGRGYDGHTFWDMEAYVLPVLMRIAPDAARDALLWRHETLPYARARAEELRLGGASFPWRTVRGEECSGYWPAGTAGFHLNAGIADAVCRYVGATGDRVFEREEGFELLVETARLWASLGHHDTEGCFRIDGVTGPDEYSALGDNNAYTNLMAARNLRAAAAVATRHPDRAAELGVTAEEVAAWERAAGNVVVPYDEALGVTQQAEGFTRYRHWDFEATDDDHYPLLLHHPYYALYSSQVVKQADLVLALYRCGEHFSPEQKRRDFEYYEAITVRDSTLSACIQSIVAAEVGHLDLAYEYLRETALVDLHDIAGNTADGVHLASLAGAWLAVVAGFGGLRDDDGELSFAPQLPAALDRIRFRLLHRGARLEVELTPGAARYALLDGDDLKIAHHGERLRLVAGEPRSVPCPTPPTLAPVRPPHGRAPMKRGIGADNGQRTGPLL